MADIPAAADIAGPGGHARQGLLRAAFYPRILPPIRVIGRHQAAGLKAAARNDFHLARASPARASGTGQTGFLARAAAWRGARRSCALLEFAGPPART